MAVLFARMREEALRLAGDLLAWYARQMRAWLPQALLAGTATARALVLDGANPGTRSLQVLRRRAGQETAQPPLTLDASGPAPRPGRGEVVVLRLAPGVALERTVTLPLAAERDLISAVRYEMDRYTPFTAEDLYWTVAPIARDRAGKRLEARLTLVPKAALAPLMAALAARGLSPVAIEAPAGDGPPRPLPLTPPDPRQERRAVRRTAGLAAICLLLVALNVALPFWRQAEAEREVEARIAELRSVVARAEAVRGQLAQSGAGADALAAERARLGDARDVLAVLTELLPDDTHLTALSLRAGRLLLDARAPSAARLLPRLADAAPMLREVAFASSITRAESGGETFSLSADVGRAP